MTVHRLPEGMIQQLIDEAFARQRPRSLDECLSIAAHVAVICDDGPWTDDYVITQAAAMAEGLFADGFLAADYGRRTFWIDACERALRAAIV